jgi:putative transposase
MPESSQKSREKVVKSISFRYTTTPELASLLEDFRLMCNEAIRIATLAKPRNRFKLIELAYPRLKEFGLHTHYVQNACEVAFAAYHNKNRKSIPYIRRAFLKLDNQSYVLNHLILRIPITPRHFIFLVLQGSEYHVSFIDDKNLKKGSIVVNNRAVIITFSKESAETVPYGFIGVDVNERNVTVSATNGYENQLKEIGEVAEIKERYKDIRAKIGRNTFQDNRICKRLYMKFGAREKGRTVQRIHRMSSQIVAYAQANRLGIKMEKLTGIRSLYRKGNGQGTSFRGRMNNWVFRETQRQIEYKAKWEGISVWYVNPRGSSSKCPNCGSRVMPMAARKLYCPKCDKLWDRDDLASKNIMACAVPQVRPSRGSGEGERDGDGSNPLSRWGEAIPDGRKQLSGSRT